MITCKIYANTLASIEAGGWLNDQPWSLWMWEV